MNPAYTIQSNKNELSSFTSKQELLQLFGIPFVLSPGEAEAQCAYLDATHQTDGSICDDSDIWLFGARRVYRYVFNQKHRCHRYTESEVQRKLGLNREKLIALALLVGSDYTDGVDGVGAVKAVEIMAEFRPAETDTADSADALLGRFSKWHQEAKTRLKGDPKAMRAENSIRRKFLTGIELPLDDDSHSRRFPDSRITDAYRSALVDESREPFTWARPNIDGLRQLAARRFGWTSEKSDSVLKPLMKRLADLDAAAASDGNGSTTAPLRQTRIEHYFAPQLPKSGTASIRLERQASDASKTKSRRLRNALLRVNSTSNDDAFNDAAAAAEKKKKPKKATVPKRRAVKRTNSNATKTSAGVDESDDDAPSTSSATAARGRRKAASARGK